MARPKKVKQGLEEVERHCSRPVSPVDEAWGNSIESNILGSNSSLRLRTALNKLNVWVQLNQKSLQVTYTNRNLQNLYFVSDPPSEGSNRLQNIPSTSKSGSTVWRSLIVPCFMQHSTDFVFIRITATHYC